MTADPISRATNALTEEKIDRAKLLRRAGATSMALGLAPWVATTGAYASSRTIKIGWVAPLTGPLASFGEANKYTVSEMQKLFGKGIRVGKNTYPVEILLRDSQSNTSRGASVAQSLILDDNIDLMLVSSTPITTNPVSDVCEANGMPCIVTDVPWQAWFFGRKGNPAKPFKWTYHFFWGLEDIIAVFMDMWSQVPTNKVVGALYPNDPDGAAWADKKLGFPPVLEKAGYKLINPGLLPRAERRLLEPHLGVQERRTPRSSPACRCRPTSSRSGSRRSSRASTRRWRRSRRALLFPSDIEALGKDGAGMATELWWNPKLPYRSSLTHQSAAALAAQWTSADEEAVDAADRLVSRALRGGRERPREDGEHRRQGVDRRRDQGDEAEHGLRARHVEGREGAEPGRQLLEDEARRRRSGGRARSTPTRWSIVSNKRVPGLKREGKLQPIVYR